MNPYSGNSTSERGGGRGWGPFVTGKGTLNPLSRLYIAGKPPIIREVQSVHIEAASRLRGTGVNVDW